jgi:hypothetical protein
MKRSKKIFLTVVHAEEELVVVCAGILHSDVNIGIVYPWL